MELVTIFNAVDFVPAVESNMCMYVYLYDYVPGTYIFTWWKYILKYLFNARAYSNTHKRVYINTYICGCLYVCVCVCLCMHINNEIIETGQKNVEKTARQVDRKTIHVSVQRNNNKMDWEKKTVILSFSFLSHVPTITNHSGSYASDDS